MAIKKQTTYKGLNAEYWRINLFTYDDISDTAIVHLWLYGNEASKDNNLKNGLKREVLRLPDIKEIEIPDELHAITNPRDLLKSMLYLKIKESNKVEDEETNWFADAEDA